MQGSKHPLPVVVWPPGDGRLVKLSGQVGGEAVECGPGRCVRGLALYFQLARLLLRGRRASRLVGDGLQECAARRVGLEKVTSPRLALVMLRLGTGGEGRVYVNRRDEDGVPYRYGVMGRGGG